MPATKHILIPSIGEVSFSKNKLSTRIKVTVRPQQVSVTLPEFVPFREAISYVESKASWIKEQQAKLQTSLTVFSPESSFQTKFHTLKIVKGNFPNVFNRIGNGIIQFFIPERFDYKLPEIQDFIRQTLIQVMRFEAKNYLPARVDELARKHGLNYKKVFIKNASTRWGSCSSDNNINLNLHLMRLPDHLIDYVILHELAHTIEKNHGPRFWKLLESFITHSKQLNHEMKNYRTGSF